MATRLTSGPLAAMQTLLIGSERKEIPALSQTVKVIDEFFALKLGKSRKSSFLELNLTSY